MHVNLGIICVNTCSVLIKLKFAEHPLVFQTTYSSTQVNRILVFVFIRYTEISSYSTRNLSKCMLYIFCNAGINNTATIPRANQITNFTTEKIRNFTL
ncbi:hypothetical protein DSECCO2_205960 [anaerobic digester metagenome]